MLSSPSIFLLKFIQFKKYYLLYKFVLKGLKLTVQMLAVNYLVNKNDIIG